MQLGSLWGDAAGFIGDMYDVRVWQTARSADDIADGRWAVLTGTESGLLVASEFDQASGAAINLVTGYSGQIQNATVISTDLPSPQCVLALTGATADRVQVDLAPNATSAAASIECWIKMSTAAGVSGTAQALVTCQVGNGVATPGFYYAGGDQLGFRWGAGQSYVSTDTTAISDGQWHHVAVTFGSGWVQFYKDGTPTADSVQIPAGLAMTGECWIGSATLTEQSFHGSLCGVRIWTATRSASQISSYRWTAMSGTEDGLGVLVDLSTCNPSEPATMLPVNIVDSTTGTLGGAAAVLQAAQPQQPQPQQVWVYQTPGVTPIGPMLGSVGVLCTDNDGSTGATSPYLRMLEIQSGENVWSTEVVSPTGIPAPVIPGAVGMDQANVYVGIQTSVVGIPSAELHAYSRSTGLNAWTDPALMTSSRFVCRPSAAGAYVVAGVQLELSGGGLLLQWFSTTDGTLVGQYTIELAETDYATMPVISPDQTVAYLGAVTTAAASSVTAVPIGSSDPASSLWSVPTANAVTADPAVTDTTLFVPTGGTVVALNVADGSQAWSHVLSTPAVVGRPVVVGDTLFVGSTDGNLYALDTATGTEQWRLEAGSAIITDVVNENGILYFATQGDGQSNPPAFFAVDCNSLGNDAVSYEIPQADTILFVQGGVTNGVVYFYGQLAIYAVNMSNVVHEFSVNSKLIVENYDIPTDTSQDPVGSDTSYRITLTLRDTLGMVRPQQPVKLWSADTLYLVNQGTAAVPIGPDTPLWLTTDGSGEITLAVSAFDDGTPSGNPNVACPPLYAWANFMAADEAVVIYPDHEQLTTLSTVQGPTTAAAPAAATGPAPSYLDQANGYDGTPLILSQYQDADSLTAIAATIRNTVGTRNTSAVGATALTAASPLHRYVSPRMVLPNALYAADASLPATRPYVPGSDTIFTVDLSSGLPVYTAGTYDPTPPPAPATGGTPVGGIFSDIKDFVTNVVKGAEKVAKLAWQFTENAVQTVIHTAENEYDLVIHTLEDAVTAVVGFLKSVVADIRKVIQWLSALFNWKNILANHAYIKSSISNPTDPSNPGIVDRMLTWLASETNGGSETSGILGQLSGKASSSMSATAAAASGQTVQNSQAGGNDPDAMYNYGGNNNSTQCHWMNQKVNENSGGITVGPTPTSLPTGGWDRNAVITAHSQFMTTMLAALEGSFSDLPDQVSQQVHKASGSFKDPKTFVSTGLSDIIGFFEVLGDDFVAFAQQIAVDYLAMAKTILQQLISWLNTPISIPFVSDLYKAITHGDELTYLDLACLLGAIPGTILLGVLTGSPTVPAADTTSVGADPSAVLAGRILLGIVGSAFDSLATVADIVSYSVAINSPDNDDDWLDPLDLAADFIDWAVTMVVQFGWSEFAAQDWIYWGIQAAPLWWNLVGILEEEEWQDQAKRDTLFGVIMIVISAVYAPIWPDGYLNAGKAKGLAFTANTFQGLYSVSEILLVLGGKEYEVEEYITMMVVTEIYSLLGFASNVVQLVADGA